MTIETTPDTARVDSDATILDERNLAKEDKLTTWADTEGQVLPHG